MSLPLPGNLSRQNRAHRGASVRLALAAAAAAVVGSGFSSQAATYDWVPLTAGPFAWDEVAFDNWSQSGFPNAPEDIANVTQDIFESQIIQLNSQVTIGVLNIGDLNAVNTYTLDGGFVGSLVFDNGAAPAQLKQVATSAGDTILAPIFTTASLEIANDAVAPLTINGPVS
jgi:hypothetical protein